MGLRGEPDASCCSKTFFFWVGPLLRRGYRSPLQMEHLWPLPERESASHLRSEFASKPSPSPSPSSQASLAEALRRAAKIGDVADAARLLGEGADAARSVDTYGTTALHAVLQPPCSLPLLQLLLSSVPPGTAHAIISTHPDAESVAEYAVRLREMGALGSDALAAIEATRLVDAGEAAAGLLLPPSTPVPAALTVAGGATSAAADASADAEASEAEAVAALHRAVKISDDEAARRRAQNGASMAS